ncbi:MAG: hypothetical protein ACTSQE_07250 [Candidatus Heimdallarchaeaceae archaeon]
MINWTLEDSRLVYGVNRNDLHFLDINDDGELVLNLRGQRITIKEIIKRVYSQIKEIGYEVVPSFTLRIPQLYYSQVKLLWNTFQQVIEEKQYSGHFQGIYPIKVNPLKRVIETLMLTNPNYAFESGTKSEFIVLLKALKDERHRFIMCNGVKDPEYIALIRQALEDGYKIIISIESIAETQLILDSIPYDKLQIALRIKPYVTVKGHWGSSAGRNSKFGLTIHKYSEVLEIISERGAKDTVVAIHAHPGSQVTDMDGLREYVAYLSRRYLELHELGFNNVDKIDLGGGLPINYDNRLPPDILQSYVSTIVNTLKEKIPKESIQPDILVEAGRFVTALSSLVVVQTLDTYSIFPSIEKLSLEDKQILARIEETEDVSELLSIWNSFKPPETEYDVKELCEIEKKLGAVKIAIRKRLMALKEKEEYQLIFEQENKKIFAEIFSPDYLVVGNFSVFNSICDWVLVNQYFPVLLIDNLHKQPETMIRLVDITCDSDGEISIYHPVYNEKKQLFTKDGFPLTLKEKKFNLEGIPVGNLKEISPNYLVIALVGAYQDIVEFNHNLLGDLPDVFLELEEDNSWKIEWQTSAKTTFDLAAEVGYKIDMQANPYIFNNTKKR